MIEATTILAIFGGGVCTGIIVVCAVGWYMLKKQTQVIQDLPTN